MVQNVATVTGYVCRRKRRDFRPGQENEVTYQVWLILEVCPQGADTAPEPAVNHCLGVGAGHKAGECLKETVAEVLAGRLEGAVWKTTDDLSEDQVAGLLAGLPDMVKTLAEKPLDILGSAAGFPAPVVSFSADITVTLVLKPALEPLQSTVHVSEIAGLVLGLATGMHPLVITCVKHLAYDELGDALTHAFEQIMNPADVQAFGTQPAALHRSDMEPFSAGKSSAAPAGPSHSTVGKSMAHRDPSPSYAAAVGEASVKGSIELAKKLDAAQENIGVTARQDNTGSPPTGLLRPRADPASVTDSTNAVSNRTALS